MNVFVDGSAWVATINERDSNHQAAVRTIHLLRQRRHRLVTTNWTAHEALTLVKTKMGHFAARQLWLRLSASAAVNLIVVDPDIEESALRLFFEFVDKTWGVVDCASLIVMERTNCDQAFAFDRHFIEASRQRGFKLLPQF